ncbi:MAG: alpha/beta fold hydrolase [Nitrospirales bacterium]|nr:alpha/beta fold hydrolase [Nitrospira sp.]MDR4499954.1 alpha/beta fold hydrolase [Nitrospirales bacterium]
MTLVPRWIPRPSLLRDVPTETRLFQVDSQSHISAKCHWQRHPEKHTTIVLIHGLEGCTESHYMKGITHKAWHAGINVIRLNQRNCGGTEHLTPTLYHTGMSGDLHAVTLELTFHDKLPHIWCIGFSMGGNITLKFAGEVGDSLESLRGFVGVCPNIHPAACVAALQLPHNLIYHHYFLPRLKARLRRKARHFPGKWDLAKLSTIKTMWEFDDVYTAPDSGYQGAEDYYDQCGARHVLHAIRTPTWIITSQDDPFIPLHIFDVEPIRENPSIQFIAPATGGHCGFLQRTQPHEDHFWIENRLVELVKTGIRR